MSGVYVNVHGDENYAQTQALSSAMFRKEPTSVGQVPKCATVYERGGSLNVIRAAAFGASSGCGVTRCGCSKVLNAFKSSPVSVSQASTRVGVTSRHSNTSSRSDSRSRL